MAEKYSNDKKEAIRYFVDILRSAGHMKIEKDLEKCLCFYIGIIDCDEQLIVHKITDAGLRDRQTPALTPENIGTFSGQLPIEIEDQVGVILMLEMYANMLVKKLDDYHRRN